MARQICRLRLADPADSDATLATPGGFPRDPPGYPADQDTMTHGQYRKAFKRHPGRLPGTGIEWQCHHNLPTFSIRDNGNVL